MQPMHTIPARGGLNFDETPFLAIWEVTQSCDLACKHCRAAAQPMAHPDELTNAEGKALIDQIAEMGVPIFVFTGGDPLKRKDVFELIRYAADKGVQVALTPSATPLLTREAIFKLKEAGLVRLGISLDGSTPEIHDAFRGLPGAWARTIQAIEWANEAGIPIQVHTTISRHNAHDLDSLCALFERLAIVMWNVFFLVPVGRGQLDDLLSGEEFEQVFGKIYELSHRVNFQIKTTEAMHYRRYLLQHNLEERKIGHGHPEAPPARRIRARRAHRRRADPHRQLGHPARERRQRLPLCLPCGQRLSQRLSAHPRRQHPRDAAQRDLPQRAHLQIPARYQQAGRQVRRMRVQGDLRRLARPRLRRHRRPARPGTLLHLPAQALGPAVGERSRGLREGLSP
jgi:MoaA/NifB/PqqE/SkfB family radical SAM enzyme